MSGEAANLIDAMLDGDLTHEQVDELGRWILEDAAHAEAFVRASILHRETREQMAANESQVNAVLTPGMREPARMPALRRRVALAAAVVVAGIVIALVALALRPDAGDNGPADDAASVATLVAASEAEWTGAPRYEGDALRGRSDLSMRSGRAELLFNSGALVAVAGPCRFAAAADNAGRLDAGSLRAVVPPGARGFTIATPDVRVIDLGTRFVVNVVDGGATQVRVIEGEVRVEMLDGGGAVVRTRHLSANEAIAWSAAEARLVELDPATILFAGDPDIAVDLVDVVAGGDGLGEARRRGIDPLTGRAGLTEHLALPSRQTDGRYHAVPDLPLVDGVFVPTPGDTPMTVDSLGHRFDGFGDSGGVAYDIIWSGIPPAKRESAGSLRGVDYRARGDRQLWMHASKGITFDLRAIAMAHGGRPVEFTAEALYLTPAASIPEDQRVHGRLTADVWVLVDGRPRFARRRFDASDGSIRIRLDLTPADRMLTLAVTDGGDGVEYDWVAIDSPIVRLVDDIDQETDE